MLGVAFMALTTVVICVNSFTQTPSHTARQQFGVYDDSTYNAIDVGDLGTGDVPALRRSVSGVAADSDVLVESRTLRPDAYPKFYFQAPTDVVRYLEDGSLRTTFPGRYELLRGAWPTKPNDVVVSEHLLDALPTRDRSSFTVLSEQTRFHVTGVIRDDDDRHGDSMVAGPGTWAGLTPRPAARQFQPTEGQITVFWRGSADAVQIGRAADRVLPPLPAEQGDRSDAWKANHATRASLEAARPVAFGSDQVVVSYAPLLLIALLVAALAIATMRRPTLVMTDRLVQLGLRRRTVTLLQAGVLTVSAAVAVASGVVVGVAVAALLRITVLAPMATQPFSPIGGMNAASWVVVTLPVAVLAVGALWPGQGAAASSFPGLTRFLHDIHVGLVRRVLVALLVVAAFAFGTTSRGWLLGAYAAIAAVVLLTPDVSRLVVWLLPRSRPRLFVARGIMRASVVRQGVAAAVVAVCIAVPITVGAQLASKQANDSAFTFSTVPAGQLWVEKASDTGDVDGVSHAVASVPGIGRPVVVRGLAEPPTASGAAGPTARFSHAADGGTATMTLANADDLRRLVGDGLPRNAESVLRSGGVVDFSGTRGAQGFVVVANGGERQLTTPALRTVKAHVARAFSSQFSGAVLTSTARRLGLPVGPPVKYLYPSVNDTEIRSAVRATVRAGYDSEFVHYHVPPPAPELPAAALVFFAGLVFGGFVVLLLVITDQARRLRSYSEQLVALGIRPSWTRGVLILQTAIVVGVGLLAGLVGSTLGLRVIAGHYVVTAVPGLPIAASLVLTVIAAGLATALASRALTGRSVVNAA